jgi:uncharacterized membrane protein (DUF485 family)
MESTSRCAAPQPEWDRIAASKQFQQLVSRKKAFILPAFSFFFVYYFLLPVSVGYAPEFMSMRVFGSVNIAYLFALSQFVVGWIIAWLYLQASAKFDALSRELLGKLDHEQGGE